MHVTSEDFRPRGACLRMRLPGLHTYADRGSIFGHTLNLCPVSAPSDIGSHRAGGDGLAGREQSQTLIPGRAGAAAASKVAPQAAGWRYEAVGCASRNGAIGDRAFEQRRGRSQTHRAHIWGFRAHALHGRQALAVA